MSKNYITRRLILIEVSISIKIMRGKDLKELNKLNENILMFD
mgnify:CR=1 FL=1